MSLYGWLILAAGGTYFCWLVFRIEKHQASSILPSEPVAPSGARCLDSEFVAPSSLGLDVSHVERQTDEKAHFCGVPSPSTYGTVEKELTDVGAPEQGVRPLEPHSDDDGRLSATLPEFQTALPQALVSKTNFVDHAFPDLDVRQVEPQIEVKDPVREIFSPSAYDNAEKELADIGALGQSVRLLDNQSDDEDLLFATPSKSRIALPPAHGLGTKFVDPAPSSRGGSSVEPKIDERTHQQVSSLSSAGDAAKKKPTDIGRQKQDVCSVEWQSDEDDLLPPIPQGFQIYAWRLSVAGVKFRKEDVLNFVHSSGRTLVFERESTNAKDTNAIKVIGVSGSNWYFLGYVPAGVAEQIVGSGLSDFVRGRLERVYEGRNGYVDIIFQVIGPKSHKQIYFDFPGTKPADTELKEFYKFFNLAIPQGLTVHEAKTTIDAHAKMLRAAGDSKLCEWEAFEVIRDEVDDAGFRSVYGIKKISRSLLKEALAVLQAEGMTLVAVRGNIQMLVDKILELKPTMARADA